MNTAKAMHELLDGKKITKRGWGADWYLCLLEGDVVNQNGDDTPLSNYDWLIYNDEEMATDVDSSTFLDNFLKQK